MANPKPTPAEIDKQLLDQWTAGGGKSPAVLAQDRYRDVERDILRRFGHLPPSQLNFEVKTAVDAEGAALKKIGVAGQIAATAFGLPYVAYAKGLKE